MAAIPDDLPRRVLDGSPDAIARKKAVRAQLKAMDAKVA
jgi:hypothetical protein